MIKIKKFFINLRIQVSLFILLVYCVFQYGCQNGPKLRFMSPYVNLGAVKPGDMKVVWTIIKNTGTSDLIIEDITAACQCIETKMASNIIRPNETDTLKLLVSIHPLLSKDAKIKIPVVVKSNTKAIFSEINISGFLKVPLLKLNGASLENNIIQ